MLAQRIDEKAIFNTARRIDSREAQASYLRQVCGTDADALRRLVELLQVHEQEQSFLESPAVAVENSPTIDRPMERPGTLIGPYKLLQQIGEGGFGIVFLAEQLQPVRRRVAVKVIRPGMDTRQVIARFEAERQALAVMDHANIARVLDAGATESGRPYFVMELVRGIAITDYCDENSLSVRERLELFATVCQAIQHAHTKGIIHRDIKPTNVLITRQDGQAVVKVIDFGVAKAMGQQLTEKTLFTEFAQMIGTPLYMSPEQAELSSIDIDTRSDIYSLGVLLYELLTGSTPVSMEQLKHAAFDEIRRIIREDEPPKPSTRISTLGLAAVTTSARRRSDPGRLRQILRGELDWIVMKAVDKDRARRYETASAFAMDILRHLADEPVQACPPSTAYQLKKFTRRYRAAVLTGGATLLLLVAGIAGTTYGLIWAEHRRGEAEDARAAEAEQRQIADFQKKKAEQAQADTLADYRASTDEAIEQLIGSKPDLGPKERSYLERALKRWQAFAVRVGDDERGQAIRAEGHFRVASLWQRLGHPEEARTEFESCRDLQTRLAAAFPSVPQYQQSLAATHHSLGSLLKDLSHRDAARVEYERARDLRQKLFADFPTVPEYRHELTTTQHSLGKLLAELGQRDAARIEYEAARDLQMKLVIECPAVPQYRQELARTHSSLGLLLQTLGQGDAARAEFEAAHELNQELVADFPVVPQYQIDLAESHHDLAGLQANRGERDAARLQYETARDRQQKLVSAFPAVPHYQHELATIHNSLGNLLSVDGQRDAARAEYEKACDLFLKLATNFPTVPQYQVDLGCSYCNVGLQLADQGKWAETLPWYELAIQALTPIYEADRRAVKEKSYLRKVHSGRAWAYDHLKKYAQATKDWAKATELNPTPVYGALTSYRAALRVRPESAWLNDRLAWYLTHRRQTTLGEARQAVRAAKKATELAPQESDYWRTLGVAHYRAEGWQESIQALTKSMELSHGGDGVDWFFLAMAYWQLDKPDEANQWYDEAVDWLEKVGNENEEHFRFQNEAEELLQHDSRATRKSG
jgi:serine/threonine protein kinase/tetratricopeptide (TPR) repeat protein